MKNHKFMTASIPALEMRVDQIEKFIYHGVDLALVICGDSGTAKIADEKDLKETENKV